jgi:hypothetical protein
LYRDFEIRDLTQSGATGVIVPKNYTSEEDYKQTYNKLVDILTVYRKYLPTKVTMQKHERNSRSIPTGGIDLNRSNMQMNVASSPDRFQVTIDQNTWQQLQSIDFDGFSFSIDGIAPIPAIAPILGLQE